MLACVFIPSSYVLKSFDGRFVPYELAEHDHEICFRYISQNKLQAGYDANSNDNCFISKDTIAKLDCFKSARQFIDVYLGRNTFRVTHYHPLYLEEVILCVVVMLINRYSRPV